MYPDAAYAQTLRVVQQPMYSNIACTANVGCTHMNAFMYIESYRGSDLDQPIALVSGLNGSGSDMRVPA